MAICKYLDLSTAHMTEADSKLLENNGLPFRVLSDEYGFFVTASNTGNEELKEAGFSDDFLALCEYAFKKDCLSINLDRDAQEIDGLHVNNW